MWEMVIFCFSSLNAPERSYSADSTGGVLADLLVECERGGSGGVVGRYRDGDLFDCMERLAGLWCKMQVCNFFVDPQGIIFFILQGIILWQDISL